jgi:lipid II isoglutaminyl synthase (glutamine-hydrolysing)
MKNYELTITHLYPQKMNIYGDIGNIIVLTKRAEWRGIKINVQNINIDDALKDGTTDIYFFGGGQDQDQVDVFRDLVKTKAGPLKKDIQNGAVMLAICGGYQLLGEYFLTGDGQKLEGLGIIPVETVAPSTEVAQRCIGNIITKLPKESDLKNYGLETLIGFENHSGRTRFKSDKLSPLGDVVVGIGDNEDKIHEGARYLNVIGSYMHGSFLPKNPHVADFMLKIALERKYHANIQLNEIDNEIELNAHKQILARFTQK